MFFIEMLYALLIGLLMAWVFALLFGTRGPWNSFFWFFLVIFLFSWSGGVWVRPFGPIGWGVSWLPFLFIGVFITVLLSAVTPRSARRVWISRKQAVVDAKTESAASAESRIAFDFFFWILLLVFAAVIFSHYFWHLRPL